MRNLASTAQGANGVRQRGVSCLVQDDSGATSVVTHSHSLRKQSNQLFLSKPREDSHVEVFLSAPVKRMAVAHPLLLSLHTGGGRSRVSDSPEVATALYWFLGTWDGTGAREG